MKHLYQSIGRMKNSKITMKKIIQSIVFFVAIIPVIHVTAQVPVVPLGDGSKGNPFQIGSLEHLCWIAVEVYNGNTFPNKYFAQYGDIDASETTTWFPDGNGGYKGWKPIGNSDVEWPWIPFSGRYDGNGYVISGLYINRPDEEAVGLFGYTLNARLSNINLSDAYVAGFGYTGSLAGYTDTESRIYQCQFSGEVRGTHDVGGLIGILYQSEAISCQGMGIVEGRIDIGGLFGWVYESVVTGCESDSDVSGIKNAGGLMGSSARSDYSTCRTSGNIYGSAWAGGLSGYIDRDTIELSFSYGIVTGGRLAGGFTGQADYSNITNSYSIADIDGLVEIIGGFTGKAYETSITNCYTAGNVQLLSFPRPTNDLCYDATTIEINSSVEGTSLGSFGLDWQYIGGEKVYSGVWYTFTGTGSSVTASTCLGANFDTRIIIFGCDGCGDLCPIGYGDNECFLFSEVTVPTDANASYKILVHGAEDQVGDFTLSLVSGSSKSQAVDIWESNNNSDQVKRLQKSQSPQEHNTNLRTTGNRSSGEYFGGFAGNSYNATYTGCFWDVNATGQDDGVGNIEPDPEGVEGATSNSMKDIIMYDLVSWDVSYPSNDTTTWFIIDYQTEYVSYPYLTANPQVPPPGLEFIGIPDDREIDGLTIEEGESECYDAYNNIIVQNLTVETGGELTLIAGNSIKIQPGSHIKNGAYFQAHITTNNSFCGGQIIPLSSYVSPGTINNMKALAEDIMTTTAGFRVYPNPTIGQFRLALNDFNENSKIKIEIISPLGESIISVEPPEMKQYLFDLSARQPGMYFIRITQDDDIGIVKLIRH